jgi:hypothetical protein
MEINYKEKLSELRGEVLRLLQWTEYWNCGFNDILSLKNPSLLSDWRRATCEKIVKKAESDPNIEITNLGDSRIMCPLCRKGSSTPYYRGFKLSEGLRRHLIGDYSRNECFYMKLARETARDNFI